MQSCSRLTAEGIHAAFSATGNSPVQEVSSAGVASSGQDEQKSSFQQEISHSLTSLSLACCSALNDTALSQIGRSCPKLMRLRVDGCKNVSDPGVKAICRHCPLMKKLSLASCPKLSKTALLHIHTLRDLETLKLDVSKKIDVKSVDSFLQLKPEVTVFVRSIERD